MLGHERPIEDSRPSVTETVSHTPGPWKEDYAKERGKYSGCIGIGPANTRDEWTGPALAFLPPGRDDIRQANAILIAAAPDMLAALLQVKAILNGHYEQGSMRGRCTHAVRAAIAKATGLSGDRA